MGAAGVGVTTWGHGTVQRGSCVSLTGFPGIFLLQGAQPILGVRWGLIPYMRLVFGHRNMLHTLPSASWTEWWASGWARALPCSPGLLQFTAFSSSLPVQFLQMKLLLSKPRAAWDQRERSWRYVLVVTAGLSGLCQGLNTCLRQSFGVFSGEGSPGWAAHSCSDSSGAWPSRGSSLCGQGLPSAFALLDSPDLNWTGWGCKTASLSETSLRL